MALRWTGKAGAFFPFAKAIIKLTFALSYLAFPSTHARRCAALRHSPTRHIFLA